MRITGNRKTENITIPSWSLGMSKKKIANIEDN